MAKLLIASACSQFPPTRWRGWMPPADQLTTMNYAATTVQIAFDDFYRKLDDEQKARLDARPASIHMPKGTRACCCGFRLR